MNAAELKHKQIGVLLGGLSGEREISLRTGAAVVKALTEGGYRVVAIDAGRDLADQLRAARIEVAFIALHGRYGEDGCVQGLLEMLGIPYTGSGVLASALAMDKQLTKQILLQHELPTPGYAVCRRGDDLVQLSEAFKHFPLVVKPNAEGSSLGMTIARDREQLLSGLKLAQDCDNMVLIEEFVAGLEVTVGVLNDEALPMIQIVPKSGFYDYTAKYTAGQTEYILPAPLPPVLYQRIQQVALDACRAIGCRGAARVDFMVRDREFYCLEINTIPGMTATSLLPKAAAAAGMSFNQLVNVILEDAGLNR
jgi:D-alanine-D-alanine ligase